MHFKALPATDFPDVTLDLEQAQLHLIADDTALGGKLSGKLPNPGFALGVVLELAVTGTTRKVAVGAVAVTFTASAVSNSVAVTHGLGALPLVVVGTGARGPAIVAVGIDTYTTTQFTVQAQAFGAFSGTESIQWIAIG